MVTPLLRKSTTIGIFANPSQGKTILMTFLGLLFWLRGYRVFSNYWVAFPHVLIESLEDLKKIGLYPAWEKKVALMEDFERWINSRLASTKQNISMGAVTMDFGKNNCSLIYTAKRSAIIDINVRDISSIFIEVKLILPFKLDSPNPELNKLINALWSDDLEKLWVEIHAFDGDLAPIGPTMYLRSLELWGKLYHTQEIVPELRIK